MTATGGNALTVTYKKFCLNVRKTLRLNEHWNRFRLPREVMVSPSLERLDWGVRLDSFHRPQLFCDYMICTFTLKLIFACVSCVLMVFNRWETSAKMSYVFLHGCLDIQNPKIKGGQDTTKWCQTSTLAAFSGVIQGKRKEGKHKEKEQVKESKKMQYCFSSKNRGMWRRSYPLLNTLATAVKCWTTLVNLCLAESREGRKERQHTESMMLICIMFLSWPFNFLSCSH